MVFSVAALGMFGWLIVLSWLAATLDTGNITFKEVRFLVALDD